MKDPFHSTDPHNGPRILRHGLKTWGESKQGRRGEIYLTPVYSQNLSKAEVHGLMHDARGCVDQNKPAVVPDKTHKKLVNGHSDGSDA